MDYELTDQIARKCVALIPELTGGNDVTGLSISKHIVGLRPSRKGGCRLEIEKMEYGFVVHNYGIPVKISRSDSRGGRNRISKQLGDGLESAGVGGRGAAIIPGKLIRERLGLPYVCKLLF